MKLTFILKKTFILLIALSFNSLVRAQEDSRQFYQLKIYSLETEAQVKITDNYLKDYYLPTLKKLLISNIGVFKSRPNEKDTIKKIYVLIPFSSLSELQMTGDKLSNNQEYLSSDSKYMKALHDQPPFKRIETILLKAFKDMPTIKPSPLHGPRKDRIYELRSYESPTEAYFKNKVEMFNDGGEIRLFERLNFNAVFYSEVIAGAKMPNLMYMTTFLNQESRDTHWKSFVDAPEWKEMSSLPKYQNNVSHIDITFLYPTEYSDY